MHPKEGYIVHPKEGSGCILRRCQKVWKKSWEKRMHPKEGSLFSVLQKSVEANTSVHI